MTALVGLFVLLTCCGSSERTHDASARTAAPRAVAITIDDLPAQHGGDLGERQKLTARLVGQLTRYGVPAIGFVNEQKLGEPEPDAEQVALIEAWLEAGLDLGNHTYSHPSLFTTPLEEFQADVIRGEAVTARLLGERGRRLRYFRHPFLNTGPDAETKAAFERFLRDRGYVVAPVTIDNDEWVYAFAYHKVLASGDSVLARHIGQDYVRYMDEVFAFYEQFSRRLLRREPAQILLIHANHLNADYFYELADMILQRGYRFVSLDEALEDPAYRMHDDFTGQAGISWLQRWWITDGREPDWGPEMPRWVWEIAFPEES